MLMVKVMVECIALSLMKYPTSTTAQTTTSFEELTCATNNDYVQVLISVQQQHQLTEEVARDVNSIRDQQTELREVIKTAFENTEDEHQQQQQQLQNISATANNVSDVIRSQHQRLQQLNTINADISDMRLLLANLSAELLPTKNVLAQLNYSISSELQKMKTSFQSMELPSCSDKQQQQTSQQNLPSSLKGTCIPLLVQQKFLAVDSNFFNRSWAEFKVGFNASNGNYWLGNEMLHQLTKNGTYTLRIEFQLTSGVWHWAEYSRFIVHGEASNYLLVVGEFTGSAGDALSYHDRRMFSTWDRDNDDLNTTNCGNRGGFWHRSCCHCCLHYHDFFKWYTSSTWLDLKTSRMWLMCR